MHKIKKRSAIVKAQHRVTKHRKIPLLRERFNAHVFHFFNVATPHGLIHLVRPNRTKLEKIFWIACIVLAAVPCVVISQQALHRYLHAPTVSTILRDYQFWISTYPAITICPFELPAEDNEEAFAPIWNFFEKRGYFVVLPTDDYQDDNVTTTTELAREPDNEAIIEFINALLFRGPEYYKELGKFKEQFGRIDPEDYIILNNLTAGVWDDVVDGTISFDRTVTEYGVCFSVNSILANYSSVERFLNKDMSLMTNYSIRDIQPLEEDPIVALSSIQLASKVFLHSFNEFISYGDRYTVLMTNKALSISLSSEKHTTTEGVRYLSVSQRHCRYTNESNLPHSPVYSYALCRQECKINQALKLCKCLPYYYRTRNGENVCNLDGMMCLAEHRDEITDISHCGFCVRQCENDIIKVIAIHVYDWMFNSEIRITYMLTTQTRIRLETIYSEINFLVQIGGLAGLAYGVGLLSVVELAYFLTLRLYFALRGRTVKAYTSDN